MSESKLNLLVKFTGVDKLSGAMRNISGGTKTSTKAIQGLRREVRLMEKDLARVEVQMSKGGGAGLSMAQRELKEAIARTNAEIDKHKAKLERITSLQAKAGRISSMAGTAGTVATATITAPLMAFTASAISAGRANAAAAAQVKASLASMGQSAGRTFEQLNQSSLELMRNSLYEQADIQGQVQATLLTFGNVSGQVFDKAQQAALDMSAKLGGDLKGASLQLGKALNDPVKGVTALSRAGVSFSQSQKDMIRSMTEAGDLAGAQNIILSEMQKQFGGSAKAAREADPGGALALSFAEFQGAVGDSLLPVLGPLMHKAAALIDKFAALPGPVKEGVLAFGGLAMAAGPLLLGVSAIAKGVAVLAPVLIGAKGAFMALGSGVVKAGLMMLANPMVLAIVAIGAVLAGVAYLVYSNWDKISGAFSAGWEKVKSGMSAAADWLKQLGGQMMRGLIIALNPVLLVQHLIDIAKKGITAFKNFFGIKSPSRLFMAMGGHMTTGLAQGIDKSRRAPLRAMGRMAAGVAGAGALSLAGPALASAGGAGGGIPAAAAPVTINVYQQPGEDAQALAERIGKLIEDGQRTRRLSSYADDF